MEIFRQFKSKLIVALACTGLALGSLFSIVFLFASYEQLTHWYLAAGPAFYRQAFWSEEFFTQNAKSYGNLFCIAGLLACTILFFRLLRYRQIQKANSWLKCSLSWPIYILMLLGIAAWLYGNSMIHPAFDEVFSAVNCAGMPAFQTYSYYMLPNNHILFNLLNGLFFHFATDKVFTGRLISLACYLGIIIVIFHWLIHLLKSNLLAIFITLALMLQFNIWGFSFQARGYELSSLAALCSFFALYRYGMVNNAQWLNHYVIACVIGYWSIPAFLYFHVACLIFGAIALNFKSKAGVKFWKAQVVVILVVFLLYLPVICFSGLPALIANKYVASPPQTWTAFFQGFGNAFQGLLIYFSNDFVAGKHIVALLFFLMPFTLFFFYRNKPALLLGIFYVSMWLSWFMVAGLMQLFPPNRIISSQLSISLVMSFYSLYLLLSVAINQTLIRELSIVGFSTAMAFYFFGADGHNINYKLYDNDINGVYSKNIIVINSIPHGGSVNFSDESFYPRYLYLKKNGAMDVNALGAPQYYISTIYEHLPFVYHAYVLKSIVGGYKIYQEPALMTNPGFFNSKK